MPSRYSAARSPPANAEIIKIMTFAYFLLMQIIRILKPLLRIIPHKKIQFFFQYEGQLQSTGEMSSRPIWIHASSGEIEYARSLVRELQNNFPQLPLLVTHTSISSMKAISELGVSVWGVAPLDTPQDLKSFIKKWNPRACLIARTDIWPQTIKELNRIQIPSFLFSATFAQGSKKISFFSRQILKKVLPLINKIYFVSSQDEDICRAFFPNVKGEIMGDTRYDQVIYRLQKTAPLPFPTHPKILVAGSTWEQDEKVLFSAFQNLKDWKLVLAPHEVDDFHIEQIKKFLDQSNFRYQLWSTGLQNFSWEKTDVLLVDKVGVLASLYPYANISFVGGSFKRQVHSVMEALAAGSLVIVGPFYENNREAIEFKDLGFVETVKDSIGFCEAVSKLASTNSNLRTNLEKEILKRQGTTQKIVQDLEACGIFK
jgi:3-deoxy-D-manno-octulosonic-acid transferase